MTGLEFTIEGEKGDHTVELAGVHQRRGPVDDINALLDRNSTIIRNHFRGRRRPGHCLAGQCAG
jgi:hypothetical protein